MSNAINPKPGDVFALPHHYAAPERVEIAKVTNAHAIDTLGRMWRRRDGYRAGEKGSSHRARSCIRPWTDNDTAKEREAENAQEYRQCLDALGAATYDWDRLPTGETLAAALPCLRAAVETLQRHIPKQAP